MQHGSPRQLLVVVVTAMVVTGMLPAVTAGAFTQEPTEPHAAISGSEFVDVSDDIEVWERAGLPLRTNPDVGSDTVFTTVDTRISVTELSISGVRLDKNPAAVYDDESEIELEFQDKLVAETGSFANQDVQLVAAHIDEDTEAAEELFASRSALTGQRALSLLTKDNSNDVNFDLVEEYGTTDGDGEITGTYDLEERGDGAGFYVFFLVQDNMGGNTWGVTDDGFEESGGELSVENKSRVIGVDVATVHQKPSEAELERNVYTAGDDLTFDVDANQPDNSEVTHAVVVYNRRNFENKDVTATVDGDLNDISSDDITIEREIEDVNGVAQVSGSPDVFGLGNLQDGRSSGIYAGAQLIDFVAEQAGTDTPLDETTNDAVSLDASVTVVDGPNDGEVTVETFENWTTGRYGYFYVATGDNSQEVTTTRGELTIRPAQGRPATVRNGQASVDFQQANVSRVGFNFDDGASGNVNVVQRSSPDKGVPSVLSTKDRRDPIYLNITVSDELKQSAADVEVTVDRESLDGLDPQNVSLWHYTDGDWVELDTTYEETNDGQVTFTARTDGFSPFSIAESTALNGETDAGDGDGSDTEDGSDDDDGPSSSSGAGGDGSDPVNDVTVTATATATATATTTPTPAPTTTVDESTDESPQTATGTATPQPDQTTESAVTETQFPGLGITATLVAFVFALLLGWRRRQN